MFNMASTLIVSALLGLSIAQTITLHFPYLGGDADSVDASVVSANSDATTFALACLAATQDCGLFPKQTLIIGPSTYNMDMSDPTSDFTATQDCVVAASSAVCKETAGGSEANFPGSSTTTYEASDLGSVTVIVTAGAEKLSGSAKTTAAGSATSAASSASASAKTGSGASATTASAAKSGSAAASSSTGAAAAKVVVLRGGLFGAAAGLFGGLLL